MKMSRLSRYSTKGFTLLEMVVVIVVIGILAALIGPRFAGVSTAAQTQQTVSNKAVCNRVLEAFEQAGGTFGGASTATQMNNTSATTLYADLVAGKTINAMTFTLPTGAPATLPTGWTITANRFQ